MNEPILPKITGLIEPHYFPCIEYIHLLKDCPDILLDINMPFKKSTYINRTYISSANKVQVLSVPVVHGRHNHLPIKEVRVLYDENWPKRHITALDSAYGRSSYYVYYRDEFEQLLKKKHTFLADLAYDGTCMLLKYLLPQATIQLHDGVTEAKEYIDIREKIKPTVRENFIHNPYYQVFEHKRGFEGNLSAVDLLFNLGPDAAAFIKNIV